MLSLRDTYYVLDKQLHILFEGNAIGAMEWITEHPMPPAWVVNQRHLDNPMSVEDFLHEYDRSVKR